MYLRDITIHADESIVDDYQGGFVQRFHRQTECVVVPFQEAMRRRISTDGIVKVALKFTPSPSGNPRQLINVVVYSFHFDFAAYVAAALQEKKRRVLHAMTDALLHLGKIYDWESAPLLLARDQVLEQHLEFSGKSKKSWLCPARKYRARIGFELDLDSVELYAVLHKNRSTKEIGRVRLGADTPYHGCLDDFLRQGKWLSHTKFQISGGAYWKQNWIADFSEIIG